ncbi:MAG: hypothetical protein ACTHKS_14380 [Gaiellaceae bacterium]
MTRLRVLAVLGGGALLLGGVLLHASILLDAVHSAIGVVAILIARPRVIALASLVLWLLGVFAAGAWLSLDRADNWLHFVVAAVLLGLSLLVGGEDLADDLERDLGGRLAAEV